MDAIRAAPTRPVSHLPRSPAPSTPPTPTRRTGRPTWPVPAPVRSRPRPADRHHHPQQRVRDPQDMWRWHPDNTTPQAWADSRTTLQALATLAEDHGLTLAVEPEHSNVVATADQAITMFDQIGSAALKIVYDAANLLDPDGYDPAAAAAAITRDIATLGPHIALGHAKELIAERAPAAPGTGLLPWPLIVQTLHEAGFDGTLVIHGLPEASVPLAVTTLEAALAVAPTT